MAFGLRETVSELMIYDADDYVCSLEAAGFVASHECGAWRVAAKGIQRAASLSWVLDGFENIVQLSFCTHGSPGRVHFNGGDLSGSTLNSIVVRPNFFRGPGRLLFMGCETARTATGEAFLIAAGRQFFGAQGGIVGGATISTLGYPFGTVLPFFGVTCRGFEGGKLVLFRLNGKGEVIADMSVRPFGI